MQRTTLKNFQRALLTVVATTLLLAAPQAYASSTDDIISECVKTGKVKGKYTPKQLRNALNNLPSDVDQYSDCRDRIKDAQLNKIRGKDGSESFADQSDNSDLVVNPLDTTKPVVVAASPEEFDAILEAQGESRDLKPIEVDGEEIDVNKTGLSASSGSASLPKPVVGSVLLLGLGATGLLLPMVRSRFFDR